MIFLVYIGEPEAEIRAHVYFEESIYTDIFQSTFYWVTFI